MPPTNVSRLTNLVSQLEHRLELLQAGITGRVKPTDAKWAHSIIATLQSAMEELRTTEQELTDARAEAESERERYRDLFDLAPDGYLVTDPFGVVAEANRAVSQLVNVHHEYITQKPLAVYVARDDLQPLFSALSAMRQGVNSCEVVLHITPRGGEPIVTHARAAAIRAWDGRLRFIRWIIRDVTGQFHAQQELARSREQLKELASELAQAEQRERRRIAEGIHDQAIQTLALAKMTLSAAIAHVPAPQRASYEEGVRLVGQAMDDLRSLIFELSPPVLYELGLGPALEWLGDQFQHRHSMNIEVRNDIPPNTLPVDLRVPLFHATRELLINVVKHAKATRVVITTRLSTAGVRINVIDNGRGFRADSISANKGFGIFSLRNRMEHMGGRFRIRSMPARFTCARIFVPLSLPLPIDPLKTDSKLEFPSR